MIRVTAARTPDGVLRELRAVGHAGWDESGKDILCAAVSVVAQTAIGGLQDVAGIEPEYTVEDGRIRIRVPAPDQTDPETAGKIQVIMETAAIGCRQIEETYGSRYVQVRDEAYKEY